MSTINRLTASYATATSSTAYPAPAGHSSLLIREHSASQVVYVEHWFAELLAKSRQ